jgi:hypothetical protein
MTRRTAWLLGAGCHTLITQATLTKESAMPNRYAAITLEERFWSKVHKTPTCWLWIAAKFSNGYGHFYLEGRHCLAHRVSWELLVGPIPDGLLVCHNCPDGDNPGCVNPAHLWLGDDKANVQDMMRKGRFKSPNPGLQGRWSTLGPDCCQGCGTTTKRHYANGYCKRCNDIHIVQHRRRRQYQNMTPEKHAAILEARRAQYQANPEKYREEKRRSAHKKKQRTLQTTARLPTRDTNHPAC